MVKRQYFLFGLNSSLLWKNLWSFHSKPTGCFYTQTLGKFPPPLISNALWRINNKNQGRTQASVICREQKMGCSMLTGRKNLNTHPLKAEYLGCSVILKRTTALKINSINNQQHYEVELKTMWRILSGSFGARLKSEKEDKEEAQEVNEEFLIRLSSYCVLCSLFLWQQCDWGF